MRIQSVAIFLIVSLFVYATPQVYGQLDLTLRVDTNHIRIGEQVGVKLIVINHSPDSPEISWPFSMDTLSKSIEVLELLAVDTQAFEEETIFTQQWYITSFDTGYQQVPSFEVIINGEERETDPFLIQVETVKIDTTQAIRAIKGVEDAPISIFEWIKYHWKWFAGFAVLTILLFGIYLIIKNKNKGLDKFTEPEKPAIPPFELALERMQKLKEGKWWQQGDVKHFHASISEILREYLENEFEFPALEQTTREVMRSIRLTDIESAQQKHLRKILLLSDLVKYAKEKPVGDENEEMFDLALQFINKTKPSEEEPTGKKEDHEA